MLVLSLFPGIGILDKAFEDEGFTIVRGPDLLWGGDIKRFHPPAGRFDGIIGGSPCQAFSRMVHIVRFNGYKEGENLVPEFERVIAEAQPSWWVMENVRDAPIPSVPGYQVDPALCNNRWLGEVQSRLHRFSFGTRDGRRLHFNTVALENPTWAPRVCSHPITLGHGGPRSKGKTPPRRAIEDACEHQGLPRDFFQHSPFRKDDQHTMLGNAVPYPLGRALATAVREALL